MQAWAPWRRQRRCSRSLDRRWGGVGTGPQGLSNVHCQHMSLCLPITPASYLMCGMQSAHSWGRGGRKHRGEPPSRWGETSTFTNLHEAPPQMQRSMPLFPPLKHSLALRGQQEGSGAGQVVRDPGYLPGVSLPMTGTSPCLDQGRGP